MRRLKTFAFLLSFTCSGILQAGFINSSGAGAFARNNDASLPFANDIQDLVAPSEVGYLFQVNSPITINSLGIWDGPGNGVDPNSGSIGDGLEQDAVVSLWTSSGVLLAQTTVAAGTAAGADEFAYGSLASDLTLMAGYFVLSASYESGGNSFYNGGSTVASNHGGTAPLTTMSEISILANRYGPQGSVPEIEDARAGLGGYIEGYIGPSAAFVTAIPEPSSFLFLGLIGTASFAWNRRRHLLQFEVDQTA